MTSLGISQAVKCSIPCRQGQSIFHNLPNFLYQPKMFMFKDSQGTVIGSQNICARTCRSHVIAKISLGNLKKFLLMAKSCVCQVRHSKSRVKA